MANLSNINDKFLVTTGGNVLIGQTGAIGSSILQVTGASTFSGNITGTTAVFSGSGTILSLNRNAPGTALIELKIANTIEGYLGATTTKSFVVYSEAGSEKAHVENNGNIGLYGSAINFLIGDFAEINFRESGAITIDSDNNQSSRNFQIKDGSGSSLMLIEDTGNVGIGVTSPTADLHIESTNDGMTNGQNTNQLKLSYGASVAGAGSSVAFGVSSVSTFTGAKIVHERTGSNSVGDLSFWTRSTAGGGSDWDLTVERMRIDSSGNVLIGTAIDAGKVTIQNDTANAYALRVLRSTSTTQGLGGFYEGASNEGILYLLDGSNGLNAKLSSSGDSYFNGGNVGIGTSSPSRDGLNVFHTTGRLGNQEASGTLSIFTNNSTGNGITILSSGNVGIGTTSPSMNFQVKNNFFEHALGKSHTGIGDLFSIQFGTSGQANKGSIIVTIFGSRFSPGQNDYAGGAVYYLTRANVGTITTVTASTTGTWQPVIDTNNTTKIWTFTSASPLGGSAGNFTTYSVTIQGIGHNGFTVINPTVTIL